MQKKLRPLTFKEFIGQDKIKHTLNVMINSSQARKSQIDHILLFGESGIGKTTLASVIATALDSKISFAQGPMLEKKSDILSLIGSIQKGDIIFVDEIHGINKNVEELLYSVLEDGIIDVAIGPEGDSKIMRLKIPPFTLIGATTKLHKISLPLKNRFGIVYKLKKYSHQEMDKIVQRSSKVLNTEIDQEAVTMIARHSRKNPRIANNILKRVIDFFIYKGKSKIDIKIVKKTLEAIGVYKYGLDDSHIEYLGILMNVFNQNWVSLENISSVLKEEKINVEHFLETPLMENNLIEKTSRGRKITSKGIEYMKTYSLYDV